MLVAFILVGGFIILKNLPDLHSQLGSVHSGADRREGRVRLERNPSRRLDRLLRLHRLRSGLDRRPGSQGPGQGHADRDHRLAARLHGDLHPRIDRPDDDRELQDAERAGSGRRRGRRLRSAVGLVRQDHQGRRDHRPHVGHPRADVRPDPHLLHDGPRRPPAEAVREGAPEVAHAVHQHDAGRRRSSPARPASSTSTLWAT